MGDRCPVTSGVKLTHRSTIRTSYQQCDGVAMLCSFKILNQHFKNRNEDLKPFSVISIYINRGNEEVGKYFLTALSIIKQWRFSG